CISLSSTDYIGHYYTPNSVEVEDTYLRLDKDLAAFFLYLDKALGADDYLVFLSADHGAAHNSEFLKDRQIPAGNQSEAKLGKELNEHLKTKFNHDDLVRAIENYQVVLHEQN